MRLDGNFIDDLRTEIVKGQERRSAFIKLKLTFVVSLLGVGAVNLDASLRMASLLYLVPLVAFVFDLYVIGEDFGIKRAGIFIKTSPAAPPEERLWDTDVELKRDMFAYAAGPLSSFLVCIAAGIGILKSNLDVVPFWSWLVLVVIYSLRNGFRFLCRLFENSQSTKRIYLPCVFYSV